MAAWLHDYSTTLLFYCSTTTLLYCSTESTTQCRVPGPSPCEASCSSTRGTTGDSGSASRSAPTRRPPSRSDSDAAEATASTYEGLGGVEEGGREEGGVHCIQIERTVCKSTALPSAASSAAVSIPSLAAEKKPKAARTWRQIGVGVSDGGGAGYRRGWVGGGSAGCKRGEVPVTDGGWRAEVPDTGGGHLCGLCGREGWCRAETHPVWCGSARGRGRPLERTHDVLEPPVGLERPAWGVRVEW